MEGLEKLLKLEQLYISHNGIEKIEGLELNAELTTLDLAGNRIRNLENVKHLAKLEEFWVNNIFTD
jgi:protein phosphatase 1 regulatory subunit 7